MAELNRFTWVFSSIGWLYWLLAISSLIACVVVSKPRRLLTFAIFLIIIIFGYFRFSSKQEDRLIRAKHDLVKSKFEARCRTAGEKIYRTVDNVEGILLLKIRPNPERHWSDQMWPGAAFAREVWDDEYIESFLLYRLDRFLVARPSDNPGYQFVDVDDGTGRRNRYRLEIKTEEVGSPGNPYYRRTLVHSLTSEPRPRYAVTFDDSVDVEDRKDWIAASTIKIFDLDKNELLAEFTNFAVDYGRGYTGGGERPWIRSYTCPVGDGEAGKTTRFFTDKVLKPVKKDKE